MPVIKDIIRNTGFEVTELSSLRTHGCKSMQVALIDIGASYTDIIFSKQNNQYLCSCQ